MFSVLYLGDRSTLDLNTKAVWGSDEEYSKLQQGIQSDLFYSRRMLLRKREGLRCRTRG